jgi:DNA-binding transcriptional regulator YhcF (GntR family)
MTEPAMAIYEQYRGLIVSGRLGSGEKLPPVRQVARDLDVAPGTAAKAYKMLERDGLVTTRAGGGTRVAESAALLPGSVVTSIRELVALAKHESASADDVVSALRNAWE